MKTALKGHLHGTAPVLKAALACFLKGVLGKGLLGSFQEWTNRWRKCDYAQGSYFEEYYLIACGDLQYLLFPNLVITFLYQHYTNILQKVMFTLSYNLFKQKRDR